MLAARTSTLGVKASDLEHLHRIFFGDLRLCGCGDPHEVWPLLRALLRRCEDRALGCAELEALIGGAAACHMVLSLLTEARLIEHGGSMWCSWPTGKGRWTLAALDLLDGHDIDDLFDELSLGYPHEGGPCTDACWATPPGH